MKTHLKRQVHARYAERLQGALRARCSLPLDSLRSAVLGARATDASTPPHASGVWQRWSEVDAAMTGAAPVAQPPGPSQNVLHAFQGLAFALRDPGLEIAPFKRGQALHRRVDQALCDLFARALKADLAGDPGGDLAPMDRAFREHVSGLLARRRPRREEESAAWAPLVKPGAPVIPRKLNVLGLMNFVGKSELPELLQMTQRALERVPANAPELLGILGYHLRVQFHAGFDDVDLGMVGLALSHVLEALQAAQGAGEAATEQELQDILVASLTFHLTDAEQYASHLLEWCRMARAKGVREPEQQIGDAFRRHPEAIPDRARRYVPGPYGDEMLQTLSRMQWGSEPRAESGLRGVLRLLPEWEGATLDSLMKDTQNRSGKLEDIYVSLRALRSPGSLTASDLRTPPRRILTQLSGAIPARMQPSLFAETSEYLARVETDPREREPARTRELGQRWRQAYRQNPAWSGELPWRYTDWQGETEPHAWTRRCDDLADALTPELRVSRA